MAVSRHGVRPQRRRHQRLELVPVLVEQFEAEGRRDRIDRPRLGLRLEAAHQQAADLFLVVDVAVGIAQHRQHRVDAVDPVGDDVEVLGRPERHVDAGERAELARPLASAVDDDFARDLAVLAVLTNCEAGDARAVRASDAANGDDLGAFDDLDAAIARALGERHRQVGRVGLAVARDPDRAGEVVGAQRREHCAGARRRDLLAFDAEAARQSELLSEHHHPLARLRDVDAAALLPPGREAGLGLERRVQLDAVLAHPRHGPVRPHLADETGGMPGRSAGELALLEQQHVLFAERGEVISGRAAGDAAADDDNPGLAGKRHGREPQRKAQAASFLPECSGERSEATPCSATRTPSPPSPSRT